MKISTFHRKISFAAFLLFFGITVKAQTYVTIPDAAFATYLQTLYPSCMNGNQMDITCPDITGEDSLNLVNLNIHDFDGLQYFTSLQVFKGSSNPVTSLPAMQSSLISYCVDSCQLTGLPTLPAGLVFLSLDHNLSIGNLPVLPTSLDELHCSECGLSNLPVLPPNLRTFYCRHNPMTSLPVLPDNIAYLYVDYNQLTSLPTLPLQLLEFYAQGNQLTSLPDFPSNVQSIHVAGNLLTGLPVLPPALLSLYVENNQLSSLPVLPVTLAQLEVQGNLFTSLPDLSPITRLQILDCRDNQLTQLPVLPDSLSWIFCANNQLTSLPVLSPFVTLLRCESNQLTSLPELPDSLGAFTCDNNLISCFPVFPKSLYMLSFAGNPYTCVPNHVAAMSAMSPLPALCVTGDPVNNPNGCEAAKGILGTVVLDNDSDCSNTTGDGFAVNVPLELFDDQQTSLGFMYSYKDGEYNFSQDPGNYTVEIDTVGKPYQVTCVTPGTIVSANPTVAEPLVDSADFMINCKPGFDLSGRYIWNDGWVFPGRNHQVDFFAGDESFWYGLSCLPPNVDGTVTISFTGPATYQYPAAGALTPTSVSGNTITYTIADFAAIDPVHSFNQILRTNNAATEGDEICFTVTLATSVPGDRNLNNNTFTYCYPVVNSHDPNKKEVYPAGKVQPSYNGYFNYTVHFQNTGTAPAFDIVVRDMLDQDLDQSTFEVLGYSHPCRTSINGNAVAFDFENIMLADSTSNEAASHGFVQYRIKAKPNLPAGTQITNTASIFFDFNPAIVTNTTLNEYDIHAGLSEQSAVAVSVYPNPGKGLFTVQLADNATSATIDVYNMLGEKVMSATSQSGTSQIDLTQQPQGVYTMTVSTSNGIKNVRIVKQ